MSIIANRVPARPRSRNFDYYPADGSNESALTTSTYVPPPDETISADGIVEQIDRETAANVVTEVGNDPVDNHIVVFRGRLKLNMTGSGSAVSDLSFDATDPLKLNVTKFNPLPMATATTLGGVKVGAGLSIDANGTLSSTSGGGGSYVLPIASATTLGGVRIPLSAYMKTDASGNLLLFPATTTTLGIVRVGAGLSIDANGTLSLAGSSYTLPAATANTLGGIKVGGGLSIDATGTLSNPNSGDSGYWTMSGATILPSSDNFRLTTYGNPTYPDSGIRLIGNHIDGWAKSGGTIGNLYLNADTYTAMPSVYVRIDNGGNGQYTGSWSKVSDVRRKGNMEPLGDALENVLSLETFYYSPVRNGEVYANIRKIGFSANQIKNMYPEVVLEDEEGFYSLDYADMTVVLAKALQELAQRFERFIAQRE